MTTAVHPTTITGSLGEDMARVLFGRIGWAPPVKLDQDIGTDLVTFARDSAGTEADKGAWDLGAPVFMQVKGSPTGYLKPSNRRNAESGWWFNESDTDPFDHWLSFGLPYLLVLVDTENQVAYWAEVSGEAIVTTGKGRKIFVPQSQNIDHDSAEALNRVATSRRRYSLEGAVWDGKLNDLGPADRLRTALVVPRLIAPHPNRAVESISFEEAVALVLKNRRSELVLRAGKDQCPKFEDWENHKEWSWRFLYAIDELGTAGRSNRFKTLETEARHRFERDACLVVQACEAYASGQGPAAAAQVLEPSRATKPADRGWLLAHRAAFLFECGEPKEAAKIAQRALIATSALDGDITASAIRSAAASILYSVSLAGRGALKATVTAHDHAGNWWRAQDINWALEKNLKCSFEHWSATDRHRFGNTTPQDDLATVAWTAAFSGAWDSWRHLVAMRAMLDLTSTSDEDAVSDALSALIFVGEKEATKDASRKIWLDGPLDSLHSVVSVVAHRAWTKRDEGAAMAIFAKAGDLLSPKDADHTVQRILALLEKEGPFRVHGSSWSDRWSEIDTALARLLTAASTKSHRIVADVIAADFTSCDDGRAASYLRAAAALRTRDLGVTRINRIYKAAANRADHYRIDMFEILGNLSEDATAELRREAAAGSARATRSLLVLGSTDHDDFMALGRSTARTVRSMVEDARGKNGSVAMNVYVNDPLDDLVLAALNSNNTKLWKAVTDALEARVIAETQQQNALRRLAAHFPHLPTHVQRKLKKLAPSLGGLRFGGANEYAAAAAQLRIAAGTVPDAEVEGYLLSQRRASPLGFARTLTAWKSGLKLPFLGTMVVDEDPAVRRQAGFGLVEHAYHYTDDRDRAYSIIRSASRQEAGCALLDGVAQGLSKYPTRDLEDLEESLREHRSALIRSRFKSDDA